MEYYSDLAYIKNLFLYLSIFIILVGLASLYLIESIKFPYEDDKLLYSWKLNGKNIGFYNGETLEFINSFTIKIPGYI